MEEKDLRSILSLDAENEEQVRRAISLLEGESVAAISPQLIPLYLEALCKVFEAGRGTGKMLKSFQRVFLTFIRQGEFVSDSTKILHLLERLAEVVPAVNVKKECEDVPPLNITNVEILATFFQIVRLSKESICAYSKSVGRNADERSVLTTFFLAKLRNGNINANVALRSIKQFLLSEELDTDTLRLVFKLVVGIDRPSLTLRILGIIVELPEILDKFLDFVRNCDISSKTYEIIVKRLFREDIYHPAILVLVERQIRSTPTTDFSAEVSWCVRYARIQGEVKIVKVLYLISSMKRYHRQMIVQDGIVENVFVPFLSGDAPIPLALVHLIENIVVENYRYDYFSGRMRDNIDATFLMELIKRRGDAYEDIIKLFSVYELLLHHGLETPETLTMFTSYLSLSYTRKNFDLASTLVKSLSAVSVRNPTCSRFLAENSGFIIVLSGMAIANQSGAINGDYLKHSCSLLISMINHSPEPETLKRKVSKFSSSIFPRVEKDNSRFLVLITYDFSFLDQGLPSLVKLLPPRRTRNMEVGKRILFPEMMEISMTFLFESITHFHQTSLGEEVLRHLWLSTQLNKYNILVVHRSRILVRMLESFKDFIIYGKEASDVSAEEIVRVARFLMQCGRPKMVQELVLNELDQVRDLPARAVSDVIDFVLAITKSTSFSSHFEFLNGRSELITSFRAESSGNLSIVFYFEYNIESRPVNNFRLFRITVGDTSVVTANLVHSHIELEFVHRRERRKKTLAFEDYTFEKNKFYHVAITICHGPVNLYVGGILKQSLKLSAKRPSVLGASDFVIEFGSEKPQEEQYKYSIGSFFLYNDSLRQEQIFRLFLLSPDNFNYFTVMQDSPVFVNKMSAFLASSIGDLDRRRLRELFGYPTEAYIVDPGKMMLLIDNNVDHVRRAIHNTLCMPQFTSRYDARGATFYPSSNLFSLIEKRGGLDFVLKLAAGVRSFDTLLGVVKIFIRYVESMDECHLHYGFMKLRAYKGLVNVLCENVRLEFQSDLFEILMIHFGFYKLKPEKSVFRNVRGITELLFDPCVWNTMSGAHQNLVSAQISRFVVGNKHSKSNLKIIKDSGMALHILSLVYELDDGKALKSALRLFRFILSHVASVSCLKKVRDIILSQAIFGSGSGSITAIHSLVLGEVFGVCSAPSFQERVGSGAIQRVFDMEFLHDMLVSVGSGQELIEIVRLFRVMQGENYRTLEQKYPSLYLDIYNNVIPRAALPFGSVVNLLLSELYGISVRRTSRNITKHEISNSAIIVSILKAFSLSPRLENEDFALVSALLLDKVLPKVEEAPAEFCTPEFAEAMSMASLTAYKRDERVDDNARYGPSYIRILAVVLERCHKNGDTDISAMVWSLFRPLSECCEDVPMSYFSGLLHSLHDLSKPAILRAVSAPLQHLLSNCTMPDVAVDFVGHQLDSLRLLAKGSSLSPREFFRSGADEEHLCKDVDSLVWFIRYAASCATLNSGVFVDTIRSNVDILASLPSPHLNRILGILCPLFRGLQICTGFDAGDLTVGEGDSLPLAPEPAWTPSGELLRNAYEKKKNKLVLVWGNLLLGRLLRAVEMEFISARLRGKSTIRYRDPIYNVYMLTERPKKQINHLILRIVEGQDGQAIYLDDTVSVLNGVMEEGLLVVTERSLFVFSYFQNPFRPLAFYEYFTEPKRRVGNELEVQRDGLRLRISDRKRESIIDFQGSDKIDALLYLLRAESPGPILELPGGISSVFGRPTNFRHRVVKISGTLRCSSGTTEIGSVETLPSGEYFSLPPEFISLKSVYRGRVYLRCAKGSEYISFVKIDDGGELHTESVFPMDDLYSASLNTRRREVVVSTDNRSGVFIVYSFSDARYGFSRRLLIRTSLRKVDAFATGGNYIVSVCSGNVLSFSVVNIEDGAEVSSGVLPVSGNLSKGALTVAVDAAKNYMVVAIGSEVSVFEFSGSRVATHVFGGGWKGEITSLSVPYWGGGIAFVGHKDGSISMCGIVDATTTIRVVKRARLFKDPITFISFESPTKVFAGFQGGVACVELD